MRPLPILANDLYGRAENINCRVSALCYVGYLCTGRLEIAFVLRAERCSESSARGHGNEPQPVYRGGVIAVQTLS